MFGPSTYATLQDAYSTVAAGPDAITDGYYAVHWLYFLEATNTLGDDWHIFAENQYETLDEARSISNPISPPDQYTYGGNAFLLAKFIINKSTNIVEVAYPHKIQPMLAVGAVNTYGDNFNASSDWSVSGSNYRLTILSSTHNMGLDAAIIVIDGGNERVYPFVSQQANGDFHIEVSQTPDLRFAGRYVINRR